MPWNAISMQVINHEFQNQPTQKVYATYICCLDVIHFVGMYILMVCECYIYGRGLHISGRWMLHIWTTVTYLDDGGYISVRLSHIWTMEVTYLHDCNISGRWKLHICTTVTYLDDGGYISGGLQATGLDAWASRVKCPARFVSHLHEICIYIWVVYSLCFVCCLLITVTWWYAWCIEWASGNQEEVQACLVTLWLFIISCYSLYKTTLGLLWSWFENNPHFHKYSMDFHV